MLCLSVEETHFTRITYFAKLAHVMPVLLLVCADTGKAIPELLKIFVKIDKDFQLHRGRSVTGAKQRPHGSSFGSVLRHSEHLVF